MADQPDAFGGAPEGRFARVDTEGGDGGAVLRDEVGDAGRDRLLDRTVALLRADRHGEAPQAAAEPADERVDAIDEGAVLLRHEIATALVADGEQVRVALEETLQN